MKEEIKLLKEKLNKIRMLGYVEAINENNSGIGLTLEHLLEKKSDNFPLPDYEGLIEIKSKLAYSKKPINLFKLTPEGKEFIECKRIIEKYGYYRSNSKEYKVFNGSIVSNEIRRIGLFYYFSIKVNYIEGKIQLLVYNYKKVLIDDSTYWDFHKIETALLRKVKYLALVDVWSTRKNGIKYYKYYRYNIYKLTNLYNFLNLIDKGVISITFSIDRYTEKSRFGQVHDHGTSFGIYKEDINKLFIKID